MPKVSTKAKKISCYTEEQQRLYEMLKPRQRAYVDYRSMGMGKADSYRKAGYISEKNSGQNAWILENKTPGMKELIEVRLKIKKAKDVLDPNSQISKNIDAIIKQEDAQQVIETVENADVETLKEIKFFRDIAEGRIKTVKKTKYLDKDGKVTKQKIEEISDIESRIKARKHLTSLLGLNQVVDVGSINTGNITINIVDASKKDDVNKQETDKLYAEFVDKTEEIDGETVIVENQESSSDKFFDREEDDE